MIKMKCKSFLLITVLLLGIIGVVAGVSEIPSAKNAQKDMFKPRWIYTAPNEYRFSSLTEINIDYNDEKVNDILVGSHDNCVYFLNQDGAVEGTIKFPSSVTSVDSFMWGSNKLRSGIAGSLDNYVYTFWRAGGQRIVEKDSSGSPLYWKQFIGESVTHVISADLSEGTAWLRRRDREYQKNSVVVASISTGEKKGKVTAFSYNGSKLWEFPVRKGVVFSLTAIDLSGDGIVGNIIVGTDRYVIALDENGKKKWSYDLKRLVNTMHPADLSKNGELQYVIVGAGQRIYSFNSFGQKLWDYRFDDGDIARSISSVDIEKDGIIDYYLVSAGTNIYAIENSINFKLLWKYDFNIPIEEHISIDFDDKGSNGLIFISGNSVYAFDVKDHVLLVPERTEDYIDIGTTESFIEQGASYKSEEIEVEESNGTNVSSETEVTKLNTGTLLIKTDVTVNIQYPEKDSLDIEEDPLSVATESEETEASVQKTSKLEVLEENNVQDTETKEKANLALLISSFTAVVLIGVYVWLTRKKQKEE